MIEQKVASSSFVISNLFFVLYLKYEVIKVHVSEIALYAFVLASTLFILVYVQRLNTLLDRVIGMISFFVILNGVYLAGSYGLNDNSMAIYNGLTRIVVGIILIWKMQVDIRFFDIEIRQKENERWVRKYLIIPLKNFYRFILLLSYITYCFYLMISALSSLSSNDVNMEFLGEIKELVINLLFVVVQTPLLINQRRSVQNKMASFLDNVKWLSTLHEDLPENYSENIPDDLDLDQIEASSRYIWLSVVFLMVLKAYQDYIILLIDGVILDFLLDLLL